MLKLSLVLKRGGWVGAIAGLALWSDVTGLPLHCVLPDAAIATPLIAQADDPPESDPATPPNPDPNSRQLQRGSEGDVVKELQERLTDFGYYDGEISGSYDAATETAVQAFQAENDLEPTGIFDLNTFEALKAQQENTSSEKPDSPGFFAKHRTRLLILAVGIVGLSGFGGIVYLLWRFVNGPADSDPTEATPPPHPLVTTSSPAIAPPTQNGSAKFININTINLDPPDAPPSTAIPLHKPPLAPLPEPENLNPPTTKPLPHLDPDPDPLPDPLLDDEFWDDDDVETLPSLPPSQPSPVLPNIAAPRHYQPRSSLPISTSSLPKADVVEELIRDLQTSSGEKRRQVIWNLAQRADSRAVQPLVNLLLESDSQQQSLVLEALSQIGVRTLKPMNRALALSLQDDNAQVRKNAIRDLTRIYELVAQLSQLIYCATDDPDPDVQATAKWALRQLGQIRTPPKD
ncbi:peptidoglycan-binding protein [Spirulina major]|uniref:peptidoglycan-binding protein n=1 Tax=Spirulina major TaxID=270636 RepID=UPI0009326420|nr:peptidoglycan-binding protein [Spirulina major]